MQPTLYLADTCSLRDAAMRAFWERDFFPTADKKLTILATVQSELERQAAEHESEAQDALDFIKQHKEHLLFLPELTGFPKGSVADRELFYHCAVHQERALVVYTADKKLAEAVMLLNPTAEVCCMKQGRLLPLVSRWLNVYRRLTEQYCIYLTAACVNSPAFAALMRQADIAPLFRGKMILSTASLPLLREEGKALMQELEMQGRAPYLLVQGHVCVTEKDELTARLLTHSGKHPALVMLAEQDTLSDYTELSRIPLPALGHKGYRVAVLKGNGRISMQQEPAEPKEAKAPAEPSAPAAPAAPQAPAAAPVPPASAISPKDQVRQYILTKNTKKVGDLIQNEAFLIRYAVNTCFQEKPDMLPSVIQSLSQRKKKLPAKCFAAFASTYVPTQAAKLNTYFRDKSFVSAIKRLITGSEPLTGCQSAMDALAKRLNQADEPTRKVLSELIKCAQANGAPSAE